jgi:drug/metabolite transporter (DMT)-like permease
VKILGFLLAVAGALVALIAAVLSSSYGRQMVASYILLVGVGLSVTGVSLAVAAGRKSEGHDK